MVVRNLGGGQETAVIWRVVGGRNLVGSQETVVVRNLGGSQEILWWSGISAVVRRLCGGQESRR